LSGDPFVLESNVLPLLLPLLHLSFNSNSVSFVERGRKYISCSRAQGTLATPLQANKKFPERGVNGKKDQKIAKKIKK